MLWEFVQKRLDELGMAVAQLTDDFDIMPATVQRIRKNLPIKDVTKQKLALALKCSQGDINDAIYDRKPQKETEEPSVMETVDKLEQTVETDYPELECYEGKTKERPEESPTVPEPPKKVAIIKQETPQPEKQKREVIYPRPAPPPENTEKLKQKKLVHPYREAQLAEEARRKEDPPKERWPRDGVDDKTYILATAPKTEKDAGAAQKAVAEYRTRLKNICLRAIYRSDAIVGTVENAYSRIGKDLLAELLKDDDTEG